MSAGKPQGTKASGRREDRLKAALKANLGRRKAQARARAAVPGADTQGHAADGAQASDTQAAEGRKATGDEQEKN